MPLGGGHTKVYTEKMRRAAALALLLAACTPLPGAVSAERSARPDEDGHELWLRYRLVADAARLAEYRTAIACLMVAGGSSTLREAEGELSAGLAGLLGQPIPIAPSTACDGAVIAGTPATAPLIASLPLAGELRQVGDEGFVIRATMVASRHAVVIAANREIGVLYGAFRFLRHLQMYRSLADVTVTSAPKIHLRVLDHWDNLDRTVERGYAGRSLWEWEQLPWSISPRYREYARANASIGINGAVINNVNADARVLGAVYLEKVAALAAVLRPFGIRVYLSARFTAPIEMGGLGTADPLDPAVRQWWQAKVDEIYRLIPDFGGFLVKAGTEGQPGPVDYHRTHADGANVLADALAPHQGVVMWRAFVYSDKVLADRVAQAYDVFKSLDGRFHANALLQVKNGPLDFQPREPFHPLFGAMSQTPLALELQITKEYLGQDTHLVYLGSLFEEVLQADTFAHGEGSTVARVIDGSLHGYRQTAIAGVANIGGDRNWTGSHFNQANWYAFGRFAWDPDASAADVADEWIRATFSNDAEVVASLSKMMLGSREAAVNYMTPLGLTHLMAARHHYGPGPWVSLGRPDWTAVYYHRADASGLGFDRTATGTNAVAQYFHPVRERFAHRDTVPDSLLLWFHHVRWDEKLRSGRTLWDELLSRYQSGVDAVRSMQLAWSSVEGKIDRARFAEVRDFLVIQEKEARWWRDASIQYFRSFSKMPLPIGYEQPAHDLEYYLKIRCPADAHRPRCDEI